MGGEQVPVQAPVPVQKKFLTPDDVFSTSDDRFLEIEVPEWGGSLRFKNFNAGEMIEFVESNEGEARKNAGVRLIILSLVDETGKRIGDLKTIPKWKTKDTRVMNRIVTQLMDLNDMDLSRDALKEMLETRKNASSGARTGASPTA